MLINNEALKAKLKEVKIDAKANARELNKIADYLDVNETPLLFFKGMINSQSKKILLTSSRVLFITSGVFSGVEITEIPLQKINSVTSDKGIMFGKIKILTVAGNTPTAIDTYVKDAASRFASICAQHKGNSNTLENFAQVSEREMPVSSPTNSSTPKKKKPGCLSRIFQFICLVILVAGIKEYISPSDKEQKGTEPSASVSSEKSSVSTPSNGSVRVDANTMKVISEVIPATRKKGSKAFIKQDGTTLFKESALKNGLGELAKGTEVRIREGANGASDGTPVRYKVQVMVKGKPDKSGWIKEDSLTNPVQIQTKQEQTFGDYSTDFLRSKEGIVKKIVNNVCDEENVLSVTAIPQVDGTLALDIHIKLKDASVYGEDAILRYYVNDARSLMKKIFTNRDLKEFNEVRLYGSFPMRDRYGNVSDAPVTKFIMKRRLAEKIQWDNFLLREFHALMLAENGDEDCIYWVHRALGTLK